MSTGLCRVTSPDRLAAFVGVSMLPLFAAYVLSIAYHGFMAHSCALPRSPFASPPVALAASVAPP